MYSKRAIVPIVAISLLLVLSVVVYFMMFNWFTIFESEKVSQIEEKNFEQDFEILKVDGELLYVKNNFGDNFPILSVKLGDNICEIGDVVIDKGIAVIDIGDCTLGYEEVTTQKVTLVSNFGVLSQNEILRSVVDGDFMVRFLTSPCDFSLGYIRLYGLSDFDDGHAELWNSSQYTYNVCIRHFNYTLSNTAGSVSQTFFNLTSTNNSAVWIDNSQVYGGNSPSGEWFNVKLFSSGGTITYNISSEDLTSYGFKCIGKIEQDDVYGSHIGDCSSSLSESLWLKFD